MLTFWRSPHWLLVAPRSFTESGPEPGGWCRCGWCWCCCGWCWCGCTERGSRRGPPDAPGTGGRSWGISPQQRHSRLTMVQSGQGCRQCGRGSGEEVTESNRAPSIKKQTTPHTLCVHPDCPTVREEGGGYESSRTSSDTNENMH